MSEYEVKKYPNNHDDVDVNREVRKRVIAIVIAIISVLAIVILVVVLIGKFSNSGANNKRHYQFNYDNSSLTIDTSLEEDKYLFIRLDSDNKIFKMTTMIWSNDPNVDLGPAETSGSYIYHAKGISSSELFISFSLYDIKNATTLDKSLLSEVKYEIFLGKDNKKLLENFDLNNENYDVTISSTSEIYLNSFNVSLYI